MATVTLFFAKSGPLTAELEYEWMDMAQPDVRHITTDQLGLDPSALEDCTAMVSDGRHYAPAGRHPIWGTYAFKPNVSVSVVTRPLAADPWQPDMFPDT